MAKINSNKIDSQILIPIYNDYLKIFSKCDQLSVSSLNLMGILFHELMFIASSLVYKSVWNIDEKFMYPFVGYRKNKYKDQNLMFRVSNKKFFTSLLNHVKIRNKNRLGIVNPGLNISSFIKLLNKNKIKFTFINKTRLEIPEFEKQLNEIYGGLTEIFSKYNLEINLNTLINSIRVSFEKYKNFKGHDCEMIITGSPVNIPARIIAADALSKNIPVLCIDHGNETGTEDNPAWGYDEQSFCTHFLGFGEYGKEVIKNSHFMHPLHGKRPKYFSSSSPTVKNIFKTKEIVNFPENINKCKLAYVPNKLMGINRLGPFLSISDSDYIDWQRSLLSAFPNIVYKAHPKEKVQKSLRNENITKKPLEECVDYFDVFIIDNAVSTSFANLASTNKPIIYFNIGIGNLTLSAERSIKERVMWIDIDITKKTDLFSLVSCSYGKKYYNNHTQRFSLSKNEQSRESKSLEIIKSIFNHV